tara:strand:- start:25 stop:237 length:213 start_codon:yes stop_codon:yes gene_type:complete
LKKTANGAKNRKYIIPITNGLMIMPRICPILIHNLFNGVSSLGDRMVAIIKIKKTLPKIITVRVELNKKQ